MDDDLLTLGLVDEADIVLDEAALSLALLDHPDTDLAPYDAVLAAIAARLADVGSDAVTAHARADTLSAVLGGEYGFVGDQETYDDPANADLIRVIDRRRGLPVSLAILYVAAARRVGWIADVLDVPGHVLVLVGGDAAPIIVDPFRGGVLVAPDELVALVAARAPNAAPAVTQVAAMPNRAVLVRLLTNQASRAAQAGHGRRALELYTRMTVMAPAYGPAWWERARLELMEHDVSAARTSLAAMLEITREPSLRSQITNMLSALVGT